MAIEDAPMIVERIQPVELFSAIKAGVDGIEIDIRRSDDQLILLHDSTVTRTTNGYGSHKGILFHP